MHLTRCGQYNAKPFPVQMMTYSSDLRNNLVPKTQNLSWFQENAIDVSVKYLPFCFDLNAVGGNDEHAE